MILLFCQKNQRWSSPEKIRLEVIDILDRILERVPTILCTFMETFKCVFIYCFPVKKLGNLMYRIEIWLLLQFFWWEIFFSLLLIFFSFYHNKIHPVTNYKAIKNKINKTRQHRTFFFKTNKTTTKKQTHTHTKKKGRKENEMELLAPAPFPFHFELSITQSYDQ